VIKSGIERDPQGTENTEIAKRCEVGFALLRDLNPALATRILRRPKYKSSV
jgi:hypothetical protein